MPDWTQERAESLLSIVQALSEGKTIQYRSCGEWVDMYIPPTLDSHPSSYRIKPDPVVKSTWTNVYPRGPSHSSHACPDDANGCSAADCVTIVRTDYTFEDGKLVDVSSTIEEETDR